MSPSLSSVEDKLIWERSTSPLNIQDQGTQKVKGAMPAYPQIKNRRITGTALSWPFSFH